MRVQMTVLFGALLAMPAAGDAAGDERFSDAKCERIEREIRRIHSRMRAGYSAAQGVKLEARLRELKSRRARHCR